MLFPAPHALLVAVAGLVIVMAVAMRTDFPPGEIADHDGASRGQSIDHECQTESCLSGRHDFPIVIPKTAGWRSQRRLRRKKGGAGPPRATATALPVPFLEEQGQLAARSQGTQIRGVRIICRGFYGDHQARSRSRTDPALWAKKRRSQRRLRRTT